MSSADKSGQYQRNAATALLRWRGVILPSAGLRLVFKNAALLAGFRIAADLALLLFYVTLSHTFGAHGLGLYAYGMALTATTFTLPGLGFVTFLVRSGSASSKDYADLWPAVRRVSAIGLGTAALVIVAIASLLPFAEALSVVIIGSGQLLYYRTEIYRTPFAITERLGQIAFAELVYKGAITILGVVFMKCGAPLPIVLGAFPISGLAYLLVVRTLSRPYQPPPSSNPASLRQALRAALPFLATVLVETPIYRQYPLLLAGFSSLAATGLFTAAYKPVEAGLLCLGYLNVALLPTLTRMGATNQSAHARLFWHALVIVTAVAGVGAAVGILIAPWFIDLLFGPRFDSAVPVLRVLCFAIVAASVKRVMITRLIAARFITHWTIVQLTTGLAGLATGLMLVSPLGATGAAIALTIGEIAGCVAAFLFVRVSFRQ